VTAAGESAVIPLRLAETGLEPRGDDGENARRRYVDLSFRAPKLPSQLVHNSCLCVYHESLVERLNITLDDERAQKLARLAEHMHIQPGTVARSLLSSALDDTDPDARHVTDLLDEIPGALERARLGRDQAHAGETISLDKL
jgi:hypothetical protein